MIRSLLVWLVAVSFIGIGAGAALAPEALAENYGIPIEDDAGRAFVRAVGARDAILGLLIAAFARAGNRPALTTTIALSALAGASDYTLVRSTRGGTARVPLTIHAVGTVGLIVTALLTTSESA